MELENIDKEIIQSILPDQAWHYHIVPFNKDGNKLFCIIDDTRSATDTQNELEILTGLNVVLKPVSYQEISKYLNLHYRKKQNFNKGLKHVAINKSNNFLLNLILEAKSLGSSDIHIEVYEDKCRVRIRVDGKLIEKYKIDKTEYPYLINQIKIQANVETTEKRLPQDGRINYDYEGQKFDIRTSVLPTLYGEKVVLRLLNNDATNIDIRQLGFNPKQLNDYTEGIKKPHGILLISGPTGSGKTTTLYATLKLLNKEQTNIVTIEDPIEYTLQGINQVQLKEDIGLTFASALRTFLRQDPDIIMVGEIRDAQTAQMAIRAALTGHLVLSTIHTNSAWGTISRLADMGIPPYLIANTLNTSVAQRLVRLLCPHCKSKETLTQGVFPKNYVPKRTMEYHFVGVGCENCYYTGYAGRKALYEVIPVNHSMAELIKQGKSNIKEDLEKTEISTLADSAFELFEKGETSMEEIYAILIGAE